MDEYYWNNPFVCKLVDKSIVVLQYEMEIYLQKRDN